jgi:hypothetical protein
LQAGLEAAGLPGPYAALLVALDLNAAAGYYAIAADRRLEGPETPLGFSGLDSEAPAFNERVGLACARK